MLRRPTYYSGPMFHTLVDEIVASSYYCVLQVGNCEVTYNPLVRIT